MTKHLIIFTISPVQSFISQARKTGDLFAGSRILSDVSKAAVEKIKEKAEIIFPKGADSLPNRIVATVDGDMGDVCKDAENQAKDKFEELIKTDVEPEIIENQIKNFLRINYVAVPIENSYEKAYTKAEQYLGAVKHAGEFEPFVEDGGKKCSLCGERNVVVYDKNFDKKDGLCAVCAGKRLYKPSESGLAGMNRIYRMGNAALHPENIPNPENPDSDNGEGRDKMSESGLAGIEQDGQDKKGFPSTVYFALLSKMTPEEIKKKEMKLGDIQKIYETKEDGKLPKYYALIHFDGDSMGKWLSGDNLKCTDALEKFHRKLSGQLSQFAECAKNVVNNAGKTVYAGGDDFLGFIALNKLEETVKHLESCFDCKVNAPLEHFFKHGKKMSFSISVVIAHYKTELGKVLKYGRDKLKEVKQHYKREGKNGLALTYITKSNTVTTAFLKKSDSDDYFSIVGKLREKHESNSGPSSKFIFSFSFECERFDLEKQTFADFLTLKEMMRVELKRLIQRAWSTGEDDEVKELIKNTRKLLERQSVEHATNCYSIDLHNFRSLMMIADKLSAGGDND